MTKNKRMILFTISAMLLTFSGYFIRVSLEYTSFDRSEHLRPSSNMTSDLCGDSQMGENSSWKESEMKRLSNLIQRRLYSIQNPPSCKMARKILCNFKIRCGFGCQTHHLAFCMIMAYGTGRTLILQSRGWSYDKKGWESFFEPLSETCREPNGKTVDNWTTPDKNDKVQVLKLPILQLLDENQRPDYVPLSIPEDIADELRKVHSNPAVWWISEILTYIMRPQNHTKHLIDKEMALLGFTHPIVGIHVRRSDKLISEAKFHDIDEYMVHARAFYEEYEKKEGDIEARKIFLATDDSGILEDAKSKYPGYTFLSESTFTQFAKKSSRYTHSSLEGIIIDTHLLALSDFLVCTFSSNVCRLAYEMMQHYHVDTSNKVRSVDRDYYWHGISNMRFGQAVKMPVYTGI